MTTEVVRRIRGFSVLPWTLGLLVFALAIAVAAFSQFQYWNRLSFSPWQLTNQLQVTVSEDGGKWSATHSAYIDLTEAGAIELTMSGSPALVALNYMAPGTTDGAVYPSFLGMVAQANPTQIIVTQAGGRLWLSSPEPWAVQVRKVPAVTVTDTYEGSGPALLWYQGDARNAEISQQGAGELAVEVFSTVAEPTIFTARDDSTLPLGWGKSPVVLICVDSNDTVASWVFRIEQPGVMPAKPQMEATE